MSLSVTLPDEVAAGLAAEAAKLDVTPDELAAEFIAERLAKGRPEKTAHRLRFATIGASTSGRAAAKDEEMLGGVRSLSLLLDTNVLAAYADTDDASAASSWMTVVRVSTSTLPVSIARCSATVE